MPLTKQYLRYVDLCSFGVINSRKGNAVLLPSSARLQVASPALEDVMIWDPRRAEKVAVLHGEGHEASVLVSNGDHSVLAVGYEDGRIRLWSTQTHECSVTLSGHKRGVSALQYDSSGTRLVSGGKDTDVVVWDVVNEAGLYRLKGHKGVVTAACFMSTYNVLITSSKDTLIKCWDLDTQHCFQTLVGHRSEVWSLELLSNETRLITASGEREMRIYGFASPEDHAATSDQVPAWEKSPFFCRQLGVIKRQSKERPLLLKADSSGEFLACLSTDSLLEVYRISSSQDLERISRKRARKARKKGDTSLVELTVQDELKLVHTFTSKAKARSFDLLKRGNSKLQVLLGLQNNSLELHSLEASTSPATTSLVHSIANSGHHSDIRTVCFSSDDSCIASGSSESLKIWNKASQQCVGTMASGYALCSAFVPGDRHVVVGTKSGALQLFELSSASMLEEIDAHEGAVWNLSMTPDRRGLVTGSADHTVKFWEFELVADEKMSSRKHLSLSHTQTLKMSEDVLCVQFSPDQRILAVGLLDSTVKVFFADTLKFFLSLYGHKLPVLAMDISSDSTLIATCSADKNIRIWGLDFGDCHKSIFAHDDSIMCIRFVPDTHLLFSGSKDRTVKCWDADNFEHILTLERHHGEVWCLAVSHDGDTIATGSHDFSLRLWGRSQEPLVLSEERENRREALLEKGLAEGAEPVVPGEGGNTEAVMVGQKSVETMKAADRILEALVIWREERAKMVEHREECKAAGRELTVPQPHPMLVAMGNLEPDRFVLHVVKRIKSSELEECLLVMPFADVSDFLVLLNSWIQSGWEVELSCRCLMFLLRIHHQQIVSSQQLLPIMDSLRQHTTVQVKTLKDLYGFNLAGLGVLKRELDAKGTHVFADVTAQLAAIRRQRKLKHKQTVVHL